MDFWIFVAEREAGWEIARFVYAAGSYRITPYYLEAYLREDLGGYYRAYEAAGFPGANGTAADFGRRSESFDDLNATVQ